MTATVIPFPEPSADEIARVAALCPNGRGRGRLEKLAKVKRTEELHAEVLRRQCVAAVEEALSEEFQLTGGLVL